jgi:fluoroquinolone transport system permease protein
MQTLRLLLAFGRNDLISLRRDSLLVGVIVGIWTQIFLFRILIPPFTDWLWNQYRFDLGPYYALMVESFSLLSMPLVLGAIAGLLMLEGCEDNTITALRVTPASLRGLVAYRIAFFSVVCTASILLGAPLLDLVPQEDLVRMIPEALVTGLFPPVVMLMLVAFARNRIEGIAIGKGFILLIAPPIAAYFLPSPWQELCGLVPGYWIMKAAWLAQANEPSSCLFLLIGLAYYLLLIVFFWHRFQRRLSQ